VSRGIGRECSTQICKSSVEWYRSDIGSSSDIILYMLLVLVLVQHGCRLLDFKQLLHSRIAHWASTNPGPKMALMDSASSHRRWCSHSDGLQLIFCSPAIHGSSTTLVNLRGYCRRVLQRRFQSRRFDSCEAIVSVSGTMFPCAMLRPLSATESHSAFSTQPRYLSPGLEVVGHHTVLKAP
jgi:hypothetical protein